MRLNQSRRVRHFPSMSWTVSHCQSEHAAHQTSAPTLLSRTAGVEERCQLIWQVKWDVFIRSSTAPQTGAKVFSRSLTAIRTPDTKKNETKACKPTLSVQWCFLFYIPQYRLHKGNTRKMKAEDVPGQMPSMETAATLMETYMSVLT